MESRKMGKNPKVRIGLRELSAQPPGPFILWDNDAKGLCARRQLSDIITYSVIYRTRDGRQRWLKLGHHGDWTPTQARAKAHQIRFAADNGEDPSAEKHALRSGATMSELMDDYVADMESHKLNGKAASTKKSDRSRVEKHLKPKLGKIRVTAIAQFQIEHFMNGCSPGSAKRLIQLLGAIFSFGIKKGVLKDNPCKGIVKPKDVRKTRRLSEIEYSQLQRAIDSVSNPMFANVFLTLALTGWRSGEVKNLRWLELELPRQIATLNETKTGRSIRPLSAEVVKLIDALPRNCEYVFALATGRPIANLNQQFIKLGLSREITPHSLRHSFASLAADLGLPDHTISRLLGHTQSSITSRYIHMEKSIIEASDLVAGETLRLMNK
jgi:integrase